MKNILLLILWWLIVMSLTSLQACAPDKTVRPSPVHNIDTLAVPLGNLAFLAKCRDWEATMLSFAQPVPLEVEYTSSGFFVYQKNTAGIIEGPGQIYLKSGGNHFFYEVYLKNKESGADQIIDYRSPKTNNPDSSLNHQKIVVAINEWANVVAIPGNQGFFEEEEVVLSPKAGIYRAQPDIPLSSYYMQPGSCTSVPLQAEFLKETNRFKAKVGPLKDQYGNMVADGTLVTFIYDDGRYTNRMEASLIGGFARIEFPAEALKRYRLFAQVNTTISSTIELKSF